MIAHCKHCKRPFRTKLSEMKRGRAVFCSRACLCADWREWKATNRTHLASQISQGSPA